VTSADAIPPYLQTLKDESKSNAHGRHRGVGLPKVRGKIVTKLERSRAYNTVRVEGEDGKHVDQQSDTSVYMNNVNRIVFQLDPDLVKLQVEATGDLKGDAGHEARVVALGNHDIAKQLAWKRLPYELNECDSPLYPLDKRPKDGSNASTARVDLMALYEKRDLILYQRMAIVREMEVWLVVVLYLSLHSHLPSRPGPY